MFKESRTNSSIEEACAKVALISPDEKFSIAFLISCFDQGTQRFISGVKYLFGSPELPQKFKLIYALLFSFVFGNNM